MKYSELRKSIRTLDLVLCTGTSAFSKLIVEMTGGKAHTSLACWGQDIGREDGRLYVWESVGAGAGIKTWEDGTAIAGVDFFSRLLNPLSGKVYVRHLIAERTAEMMTALRRHIENNAGVPYEQSKLELLKAVYPFLGSNKEALASQFCWENTSATLQAVGLLSRECPANCFRNRDYAEGGRLPLLMGASYGPEVLVE